MRSALDQVAEIKDLKTTPNPAGGKATFKVAKDFDYETKLKEFVDGGNSHLANFKVVAK